MASETMRVASASAWAARSRASASRKAAWRWPSALRMSPCFCPSAVRMAAARRPSASRICARLIRSAFICPDLAAIKSAGGLMSLISMRVILMHQGAVASSTVRSSFSLIASRWPSMASSSMEPSTVRILVITRLRIACSRLLFLVGGLGRIDDLEEADGVDLHRGVIGGDHFLRRNIQHVFHYVELAADFVHYRDDDVQARLKGVGVATEALHRPFKTLRHHLEAHKNDGDGEADKEKDDAADFHVM